jgi:hypothetical protein
MAANRTGRRNKPCRGRKARSPTARAQSAPGSGSDRDDRRASFSALAAGRYRAVGRMDGVGRGRRPHACRGQSPSRSHGLLPQASRGESRAAMRASGRLPAQSTLRNEGCRLQNLVARLSTGSCRHRRHCRHPAGVGLAAGVLAPTRARQRRRLTPRSGMAATLGHLPSLSGLGRAGASIRGSQNRKGRAPSPDRHAPVTPRRTDFSCFSSDLCQGRARTFLQLQISCN